MMQEATISNDVDDVSLMPSDCFADVDRRVDFQMRLLDCKISRLVTKADRLVSYICSPAFKKKCLMHIPSLIKITNCQLSILAVFIYYNFRKLALCLAPF